MVSPALVVAYLFLVLVVVVVVVLLCLGCGCHVPLGKLVRCCCLNTTVCCNRCCRRKKKDEGYKNIIDDVNEENAEAQEKARARKEANDDTAIAGCCSWVPYVLTCGMCCGALKDEDQAAPGRGGSNIDSSVSGRVGAVVAQPVQQPMEEVEVVGTEHVVAVSIPLLAMG